MDKDKIKAIEYGIGKTDGGLDNLSPYVSWWPEKEYIGLDGEFDLDELVGFVEWISATQEERMRYITEMEDSNANDQ